MHIYFKGTGFYNDKIFFTIFIFFLLPGYQSILQRLVSTSTLSLPASQASDRSAGQQGEEGEDREEGGNELDLGFISHAQFDTGAKL